MRGGVSHIYYELIGLQIPIRIIFLTSNWTYNLFSTRQIQALGVTCSILTFTWAQSSQGTKFFDSFVLGLHLVFFFFYPFYYFPKQGIYRFYIPFSLIDHNAWATLNQGWLKGQSGIRHDLFSLFFPFFLPNKALVIFKLNLELFQKSCQLH